jgi:hypothetical protein
MGTELRQQYAILAKGAQERTRSSPVDVIDGDIQQVKEARVKNRSLAFLSRRSAERLLSIRSDSETKITFLKEVHYVH